jgi:hypothetical protein
VDDHFKNKPEKLRRTFDLILRDLEKIGSVRVDAVKSGINLAGKSHFGGVHVLKDSISVGFLLNRKVVNLRISKVQKITYKIYAHTVNLREPSDVDAELLNWLKEAFLRTQTLKEVETKR